jgi:UDP-2-acetamido-2,6-beta-L-arabino-hexul-4-ose reductase
MKFALTGASGFFGWHFRCYAKAAGITDILLLNRDAIQKLNSQNSGLDDVEVLVHAAGVNRADNDEQILTLNIEIAMQVAKVIRSTKKAITVINCNSIQRNLDVPYGRAKTAASDIISKACIDTGSRYIDVVLPNLFGECGKPFYNSVVATFCHQASRGETLKLREDKSLILMHVQEAVRRVFELISSQRSGIVEFDGESRQVSQIMSLILEIATRYNTGHVPNLNNKFSSEMTNTYLSHIPSNQRLIRQQSQIDPRGSLYETLKIENGQFQSFVSRTERSKIRGNHFHINKFERFCVVEGDAIIRLRKLFSNEIFTYRVRGEDRSFIDMPTLFAHSIENVGRKDLVTIFYAHPHFDLQNADTFAEEVSNKL